MGGISSGKPERGFVYCSECNGEGVIYNNADPTSGQWVECECATLLRSHRELVDAGKSALAILPHVVKFLKFQRPGREFWPNREAGEGAIARLESAIATAKEVQP